jgi:hypothetical protein
MRRRYPLKVDTLRNKEYSNGGGDNDMKYYYMKKNEGKEESFVDMDSPLSYRLRVGFKKRGYHQ